MAEEIAISLSDQEQIMSHAMTLVEETTNAVTSISAAIEAYKTLSSQGSFHDIYLGDGNDGFARFILKAQDLVTLAEVMYTHVETTYKTMIDVDKVLGVRIANNYYLNNPSASSEEKQYIRDHPEEALKAIQEAYGLSEKP
ncbi:hypothetical protein ACVR05_02140 [Streptococcus caprae]|uniref:LXG domain-containing protein n=1 Tax=Streptococcus caprae TaxID=1640501 RepID=A0ABV8CWF3_9STRE